MDIREVKIEEYWPLIVKGTEEFGQIAVAENPEFNILAGHIYDVLKDSFIKEATEYGISRWEKMLGLAVTDGMTLEDRKIAILNYLSVKIPYTWRVLKQMLIGLLGEGNFEISLDNDTQTLSIACTNEHYEQVEELIGRVVPKNLDIVLMGYDYGLAYNQFTFLETIAVGGMTIDLPQTNQTGFHTSGIFKRVNSSCYCGSYTGIGVSWEKSIAKYRIGRCYNSAYNIEFPESPSLTFEAKCNYFNSGEIEVTTDGTTRTAALNMSGINVGKQGVFGATNKGYGGFNGGVVHHAIARVNFLKISEGENLVGDFVPAIDKYGTLCMFDKISKSAIYTVNPDFFYKNYYLGISDVNELNKALRSLPNKSGDSTGTLRLYLASELKSEEGNIKKVATAKNWNFTIKYYSDIAVLSLEPTTWVRKVQSEYGNYVDSDGTRYAVDWCHEIIDPSGNTPRDYGYDLFFDEAEACYIWGLSEYQEPTEEEVIENE